jgi:hypothetical protein
MNLYLLIHNTQQYYYAQLLKAQLTNHELHIISKVTRNMQLLNIPYLDIDSIWPDTLGYHPLMDTLIDQKNTIKRKFIKTAPDVAQVPERELLISGREYRYVVINKDNYDAILVSKLLMIGNVVVMDPSLPAYDFYRNSVACQDDVCNLRSNDLRILSRKHLDNYKTLEYEPVHIPTELLTDIYIDNLSHIYEDKLSTYRDAIITKDKENQQHLKLSPTNGPESLPTITIVTVLPDNVSTCEQMLLKRCWLDNRYPLDKIQWIVISSTQPDWWDWAKQHTVFYTDIPDIMNEYIIMWDLCYYYFPHSCYAKVKLMLDNINVDTVGTTTIGIYNIIGNFGYHSKSTCPLSGTMATKRDRYMLSGKDGKLFSSLTSDYLQDHVSTVMIIPYNFNCLKIDLHRTDRPDSATSAIFAKLLSFEIQSFLNKLYHLLKD